MKLDSWEPCPRCGSNRVQPINKVLLGFMIASMGTLVFGIMGIFIWIFIIAVPFCWIIGLFLAVFGQSIWQCQDCHKSWKMEKPKKAEIAHN